MCDPRSLFGNVALFLTVENDVVHVLLNSAREYPYDFFSSHSEGGIGQRHIDMGKRSIDAMSETLKRNIYCLHPEDESTDTKVPEKVPLAPARYTCEFWVDHLCEFGGQLVGHEAAFAFLQDHFLHWLECMSLIHKLPSAVHSIKKLVFNAKSTPDQSSCYVSFLKDAERFVLRNLPIMERAPLQTYGTALALSPAKSEIRTLYWKERLSVIGNITGVKDS